MCPDTHPNKKDGAPSTQAGFTLLELMVVITIIGILAAISYPMYTDYVIKGKRAEGKALIMDGAAKLERFYSDNNVYAESDDTLPPNFAAADRISENDHYQLTVTTSSPYQTYTLTATPQTFSDGECGNLTLDSTGARGITGTGTVRDCWGG